jgi:prepilin-type processing-associated H-X9-DG protein
MNGFVGASVLGSNEITSANSWQMLRLSDIKNPGKVVVVLDEHPDSINDGYFMPMETNRWLDLPGSAHPNGACGFAFADGHSEMQRWVDASTAKPVQKIPRGGLPLTPANGELRDITWLLARMSNK